MRRRRDQPQERLPAPGAADASIFRQAWDVALDYAIRRLGDAAQSRALHGVSRPVFFQGEQIGERRHYDEKLTMFLLRYRDPVRYGAWHDGMEARRHPDGAGIVLAHALNAVVDAAHEFIPEGDDPDRPLAEGPAPAVDANDPPAWDKFDDEERAAMRDLVGYLHRHDPVDDVESDGDGRDPIITRRPRNPKGHGDVA